MLFLDPNFFNEDKFIEIYNYLKNAGIVGDFIEAPSEDPNIFRYRCRWLSPYSGVEPGFGLGTSDNQLEAMILALVEAVERYYILKIDDESLVKGSFNQLKPSAVNPLDLQNFSISQLENDNYKKFIIDENTEFSWVRGNSLFDNSEVLIPAQLVYAEYDFLKRKEQCIRLPISTGAACGITLTSSIYRGICETIERDNYLITFLNKIPLPRLTGLDNIEGYENLTEELKQYGLNIICLDASLDFKTTTIVSVIIDPSGNSPAVIVCSGCDLNPTLATKKAILETVGQWINAKENYFKNKNENFLINTDLDWEIFARRIFWNSFLNIKLIKPYLSGNEKPFNLLKNLSSGSEEQDLNVLLNYLSEKNYHAYVVNLTDSFLKKIGLYVVKVLIPELYPMYLDQRYPYKYNPRLYNLPVELGLRTKRVKEDDIFWKHPL